MSGFWVGCIPGEAKAKCKCSVCGADVLCWTWVDRDCPEPTCRECLDSPSDSQESEE